MGIVTSIDAEQLFEATNELLEEIKEPLDDVVKSVVEFAEKYFDENDMAFWEEVNKGDGHTRTKESLIIGSYIRDRVGNNFDFSMLLGLLRIKIHGDISDEELDQFWDEDYKFVEEEE